MMTRLCGYRDPVALTTCQRAGHPGYDWRCIEHGPDVTPVPERDTTHAAGIKEGERRATAAIVAWFMNQGENRQDAGKAIERGDNLSK